MNQCTHVQDAQDRFQEQKRLANKSGVRTRRQEVRRTYGTLHDDLIVNASWYTSPAANGFAFEKPTSACMVNTYTNNSALQFFVGVAHCPGAGGQH